MNMPLNLYTWIAALLPIIALLILMVKYRWGAAQAAPVGLIISVVTGVTLFKAPWHLIAAESAKGIWNGLSVMTVVLPAILIFEVTNEAGAFEPFRKGMQKFSPNELLQILAVGWVFVSFLQGVTGFGVPVAVGAPLLVGMGVSPVWAVTIPLMGHAWANTFGTLAVAWDALMFQTGLTDPALIKETALWAATFTWLMNFTAGSFICIFYGGRKALKVGLPAVALISLIHGGGQMVLSQVNQTLANFLMTSSCLAVVFLIGRLPLYRKPFSLPESRVMEREHKNSGDTESNMSLGQAFVPYTALTTITLFILLIKPVKNALSVLMIGLPFPETATGFGFVNKAVELYSPISVFTHSGTFLLAAALIGYFSFKGKGYIGEGGARRIFINTMEKSMPSTIAVILLIAMSKVMAGTGQTDVLAYGTALATGKYYALFAPFIGVLGAFMTSSNMASNILFGNFQLTTAELIGLNKAAILGAQTGGGAIGNIICPGNVLLGTTTAGILGKEGIILRRVIPIACSVAAIAGLILFIFHFVS